MVEASQNSGGFITEVPGMGGAQAEDPSQQMVVRNDFDGDSNEEFSQDEDEREENQYF